jgi:hypothetical protein
MKWVKRSNIKVDRVACPGLFNDFLTPEEFASVQPPEEAV